MTDPSSPMPGDEVEDQPALDPGEKWGQGTDASHPRSATGQPVPEAPPDDAGTPPGETDGTERADDPTRYR